MKQPPNNRQFDRGDLVEFYNNSYVVKGKVLACFQTAVEGPNGGELRLVVENSAGALFIRKPSMVSYAG